MNQALNMMACIVTATPSSAAIAQYTDLPDIVVQNDVDVELDLDGDGVIDLTFTSSPFQENLKIFSVITGAGTSVYGVDRGSEKEALAVDPGTLVGGQYYNGIDPSTQGTVILASMDCDVNCIDGFSDRSTRFLAVKVGDLFGWVRIETRFESTGRVLLLLDYTLSADPSGVFTLIDGYYIQQICEDGLERVIMAMGGFQGVSCFPDRRIVTTFSGGRIEFTATICCGGLSAPSPWSSTTTFLIPETGVYEIITTVNQGDVSSTSTERAPVLIGCCPADWNADGEVNFFDINAFLATWTASSANGTHMADLNFDGHISFADITKYLIIFTDNCVSQGF